MISKPKMKQDQILLGESSHTENQEYSRYISEAGNFQTQADEADQRGNYFAALQICNTAVRKLETFQNSNSASLNQRQNNQLILLLEMAKFRSNIYSKLVETNRESRALPQVPPTPKPRSALCANDFKAAFENPLLTKASHKKRITDQIIKVRGGLETVYGSSNQKGEAANKDIDDGIYSNVSSPQFVMKNDTPPATSNELALYGPRDLVPAQFFRQEKRGEFEELRERVISSVEVELQNVSWDSVVGLQQAKAVIKKAISIPIDYPNSVQARKASTGILLFGPGGVGKTHIIRAAAADASYTFLNVKPDSVMSKWQGESEKAIDIIFEYARENSPSILFIDECDAFCRSRESEDSESMRKIKSKLLTEMAGFEKKQERVIVIGNTNRPQDLDDAFLRRFANRVYVPLPTEEERKALLKLFLRDYDHSLTKDDFDWIVRRSEGYSGSDLEALVEVAGSVQLDEVYAKDIKPKVMPPLRPATEGDFRKAFKQTCATNDKKLIKELEDWNEKHGNGEAKATYDHLEERKKWKKQSLGLRVTAGILNFFSGN